MLDAFLDWVAGLPVAAIYLLLAALSALENIFPPVPADVAVVLGAFLSRQGHVSAPVLGVLCWLANTGSSAAMYFYARAYGPRYFETGWRRTLMPPETMAALQRAYARHGVFGIFLSRFLPGIRAAVTPFAGVVGMSPARALVPAATASALWYAFLVGAGSVIASYWDRARTIGEGVNTALGWLALTLLAALAAWIWLRRGRPEEKNG